MSILKQSFDVDQEEDENNLNNGPDFIQIIFKWMVYYSFTCNMYSINSFIAQPFLVVSYFSTKGSIIDK